MPAIARHKRQNKSLRIGCSDPFSDFFVMYLLCEHGSKEYAEASLLASSPKVHFYIEILFIRCYNTSINTQHMFEYTKGGCGYV